MLDHLAVSRSALQRMFRNELGQTILDAITAVRIQRVKQLLTETDLPLCDIADRAGFAYVEYLSTSFRRKQASPPALTVASSGIGATGEDHHHVRPLTDLGARQLNK